MYKKETEGWLKHYDFILLDMLSLQLALVFSYIFCGNGFNPYGNLLYRNMAIFLVLADAIVIFSLDTLKSVILQRISHNGPSRAYCRSSCSAVFIFDTGRRGVFKNGFACDDTFLYCYYICFQRIMEKVSEKTDGEGGSRSLLIVTTSDAAEDVIANIKKNNYARYIIAGVAIIDCDMVGKNIDGVEVVTNEETTPMYVCQEWIDEVLVVIPEGIPYPQEFIDKLMETGVTIHYSLVKFSRQDDRKQIVEKIGNYSVLTTTLNYASSKQLLAKRIMDICAGIAGCILTGIIFVFIAPAIYISSPGRFSSLRSAWEKTVRNLKCISFGVCTWTQKSEKRNL